MTVTADLTFDRIDTFGTAGRGRVILRRSEGGRRLPSEIAADFVAERLAAAPNRDEVAS